MKKHFFLILIIGLLTTGLIFAQTNFRGQRKSFSDDELSLIRYSAQECPEGVRIDLVFSEPVNPQSLNSNTVRINRKPLDRSVRITFNRDGTQARFTVNESLPIQIDLNNIKSFDGNSSFSDSVTVD